MDSHFNCFMNTFNYEDALFRIDPKLQELKDLKEMYVHFNAYNAGNPIDARLNLDDLIDNYLHSSNPIFIDFANLLIRNHEYVRQLESEPFADLILSHPVMTRKRATSTSWLLWF